MLNILYFLLLVMDSVLFSSLSLKLIHFCIQYFFLKFTLELLILLLVLSQSLILLIYLFFLPLNDLVFVWVMNGPLNPRHNAHVVFIDLPLSYFLSIGRIIRF